RRACCRSSRPDSTPPGTTDRWSRRGSRGSAPTNAFRARPPTPAHPSPRRRARSGPVFCAALTPRSAGWAVLEQEPLQAREIRDFNELQERGRPATGSLRRYFLRAMNSLQSYILVNMALVQIKKALPPPDRLEDEILRLKKERNAVLLAHYYQE